MLWLFRLLNRFAVYTSTSGINNKQRLVIIQQIQSKFRLYCTCLHEIISALFSLNLIFPKLYSENISAIRG